MCSPIRSSTTRVPRRRTHALSNTALFAQKTRTRSPCLVSTAGGEPYYLYCNERNRLLYAQYQDMAKEEEANSGQRVHLWPLPYKYFNMDQAILAALEYYDAHLQHSTAPAWINAGVHVLQQAPSLHSCWCTFLPTITMRLVFGLSTFSHFLGGRALLGRALLGRRSLLGRSLLGRRSLLG